MPGGSWPAGWLTGARTGEAIEVIRPVADAADEVAELWLARWLADGDQVDELRRRAASGSYPALHELAGWLADHEQMDQLRTLVVDHRELLPGWLARQYNMRVVRLAAELGDDAAQRHLVRWLSRLRERAEAGDEHARGFLAENPDWRQCWFGRVRMCGIGPRLPSWACCWKGLPGDRRRAALARPGSA
jgi:hypothetical protein